MVKIRLRRAGARKRPYYRIIAIDERRAGGRALEFLGSYDPRPDPEEIRVEDERLAAWLARGAQLSPTVKSLLRRARRRQPAAPAASGTGAA